jgi:hypothetical protein
MTPSIRRMRRESQFCGGAFFKKMDSAKAMDDSILAKTDERCYR